MNVLLLVIGIYIYSGVARTLKLSSLRGILPRAPPPPPVGRARLPARRRTCRGHRDHRRTRSGRLGWVRFRLGFGKGAIVRYTSRYTKRYQVKTTTTRRTTLWPETNRWRANVVYTRGNRHTSYLTCRHTTYLPKRGIRRPAVVAYVVSPRRRKHRSLRVYRAVQTRTLCFPVRQPIYIGTRDDAVFD